MCDVPSCFRQPLGCILQQLCNFFFDGVNTGGLRLLQEICDELICAQLGGTLTVLNRNRIWFNCSINLLTGPIRSRGIVDVHLVGVVLGTIASICSSGLLFLVFFYGHDRRVAEKGLRRSKTQLALVAEILEGVHDISEGALRLESPGLNITQLHVQSLQGDGSVDELVRRLLDESEEVFERRLLRSASFTLLLASRTTLVSLRRDSHGAVIPVLRIIEQLLQSHCLFEVERHVQGAIDRLLEDVVLDLFAS